MLGLIQRILKKKARKNSCAGAKACLSPVVLVCAASREKFAAVTFARENKMPFFGICLGMQVAAIECARNLCKLDKANSTEFNKKAKYPIISLLEEQKKIKSMGATMRLGKYECKLSKHSHSYTAYKKTTIFERHRHRYEFNNIFKRNYD